MSNVKSTFIEDIRVEKELSKWLHENVYSSDLFEKVVKIEESDLQHKGVDVHQTSFEIYRDRKAHAVDEKAAIKSVKRDPNETHSDSFVFELNYKKDNELKEGWLFGGKYSNTEYYQVMWLWADVDEVNHWSYDWRMIDKNNITKVEGYIIKKTKIQDYLNSLGLSENSLHVLRKTLNEQNEPIILKDRSTQVQVFKQLEEQPMNVIIKNEHLKELATYHILENLRVKKKDAVYSKTRFIPESNFNNNMVKDIVEDIKSGIKTILFVNDTSLVKQTIYGRFLESDYKSLQDSVLIDVHGSPGKIEDEEIFYNGDIPLDKGRKRIPTYNWNQYEIEHTYYKNNVSVQAGAGTGKTRTMIQRILFLVLKENVLLEEIGMITFTNAASSEMKTKLKRVIYSRFMITRDPKYLDLIEGISKMNISTIDSFSKQLVDQYSYKLGLGVRSKITSQKNYKRELIIKVINENHKEEVKKLLTNNELEDYRLVNNLLDLWNKTLSLGIKIDDFLDYTAPNSEDRLFKQIVNDCNDLLSEEKRKQGIIELSDLKFLSEKVLNDMSDAEIIHTNNQYLFVDEFQDTDNLQIDYISKLYKILNTKLFIVGDNKQSIYRFRGAEHTAFIRISKNIKFDSFTLNINYRTDSSLLEDMNTYFSKFKHLPKGNTLIPFNQHGNKKVEVILYNQWDYKNYGRYDKKVIEVLNKQITESEDTNSIAILCRTNEQINRIAGILDKNGFKGKYSSSKEGDLFKRTAATDLAKFIKLLLYPNNAPIQLAALEAPYFYKTMNNIDKLRAMDSHQSFFDTQEKENLIELLHELKFKPFLSIMRKVILSNNGQSFDKHLFDRYTRTISSDFEDFKKFRETYHQELNLIIEKIGDTFGNQTYSAIDVSKWLDIQIRTNTTDELPPVIDMNKRITLTTIHKSKGLEFDSVIIPNTHKPISMYRNGIHLDYDEETFVSNILRKKKNNEFEKIREKETTELMKEETRILYVAMTRAKHSLTIFLSDKIRDKSFAGIIKGKGDLCEY